MLVQQKENMNEDYKTIVESAQDGIIIIQEDIIKYANPYAENSLGYNREGIKGAKFLELVAEESKEEVLKNYEKTMKGEKTNLYEAKIKRRDGNLLAGEIHAHRISYKGKPADLVIIRDIKARKKTEEVLRRQEERFQAVTENTPDIISRFDEDGRYVYVNAAAEKEFGIAKKDFFWKTDKDLGIESERSKAFHDAIEFVFKNKKKKTFYSETSINDEKKYYYTVIVPEFYEDGAVNSVLSITRDITEIREIDQAKSEFISITSHQLRSPLSIINWCSLSLLRGDVGEIEGEQKEYVEKMYESTRKMIKITDAFLNTTMLDLGMFVFNPRKIDVASVTKEIIRNFESTIKKKEINLVRDYKEPLPIEIDERTLKIILRGLISNAAEYTPPQGNMEISIKRTSEEEILIEVGDSGCGIPKEDQEKVFNKFFRAEKAKEMKAYGTGLDLYLIKSLLEKVGGSIELESPNPKFNAGAVFSIRLPVTTKEENEL